MTICFINSSNLQDKPSLIVFFVRVIENLYYASLSIVIFVSVNFLRSSIVLIVCILTLNMSVNLRSSSFSVLDVNTENPYMTKRKGFADLTFASFVKSIVVSNQLRTGHLFLPYPI